MSSKVYVIVARSGDYEDKDWLLMENLRKRCADEAKSAFERMQKAQDRFEAKHPDDLFNRQRWWKRYSKLTIDTALPSGDQDVSYSAEFVKVING